MADSFSQAAANIAKNNDTNRPAGAAAPVAPLKAATGGASVADLTGNPQADLYNAIEKQGEALLADLQQAGAFANAPATSGTGIADPNASQAIAALIPLVQLVINGPPLAAGATAPAAGTPAASPGVITVLEKARIIRMAIESPTFKAAVAPLILDEVQNIQNLASGLMSLLSGASIAGLIAVPKVP